MSPQPDRPSIPRPLPISTRVLAALLLLLPIAGLAVVPLYSRDAPRLWGMPFFYWYQFLWVFIAAAATWSAYVVITRARRGGRR